MTIDVRALTVTYDDAPVLADVTATARAGRVTAVLGPNAAGKTTLLRAVIGAIAPAGGAVEIDGTPVRRLRGRALATRLAYVAQRPVVSAVFTVREVVELGRYALPPDAARVDAALARLELTDLADRPYPALSIGQQQRVMLARAVAQLAPDGHLVLDEPMSGMDLRHVRDGLDLLAELAGRGATVLVAMHDVTAAVAAADEAWLLREGRIVADGPVAEVCTPAGLAAVFDVGFRAVGGAGGRPWVVAERSEGRPG